MPSMLILCSCLNILWFCTLHPDITAWFSSHAGLPRTLMWTFSRIVTHLWRWAGNIAACRCASCVHLVISKDENIELNAPHSGPRDSEISFFFTLSSISPSSGILNGFKLGVDVEETLHQQALVQAGTGPAPQVGLWGPPVPRAGISSHWISVLVPPRAIPVYRSPHSFWKDPLDSSFSSFIHLGHT